MAENDLIITLKLDDKASKEVADAIRKIKKESVDLDDQTNKSSGNIVKGFKQASKELHSYRQALTIATVGIVAIVNATRVWADRNQETRDALDSIANSSKNLASTFGSILAPTVAGFAKAIESFSGSIDGFFAKIRSGYESVFRAITYATQFQVAFLTELRAGVPLTEAWTDAAKIAEEAARSMGDEFKKTMEQNIVSTDEAQTKLKLVNDEMTRNATLFKAGQISGEEYFNAILGAQDQQIFKNSLSVNQLNELASLTRQVTDANILEAQRQTTEQISLLNFYKQNYMQAHEGIKAFSVTVGSTLKQNLGSAIGSIVTQSQSAKEAFASLGKAMIQTVVDFMVQKAIAFALEKTFLAATVASAIPAGAAVAAAWAPAALVANIASFGGAGAAAAASFATSSAVLTSTMTALSSLGGGISRGGGAGGKFAEGTDTVPAMLTPGEMIFPRSMADAIRAGDITVSGRGGGGGGDINITISGVTISSKDSIRDLAEELGVEIERQARNARSNV